MMTVPSDLPSAVARAVDTYRTDEDIARLLRTLSSITEGASPDALIEAARPFLDLPEVAGPLYERVVQARPDDAHALVVLANSYWLAGRGPETVAELASRAIAADPAHRGGWHLWALAESSPRERVTRWRQVVSRFPTDDLARANLADNAAALAGAEHDDEARILAVSTYRELLSTAAHPDQRGALENAIRTLESWRL